MTSRRSMVGGALAVALVLGALVALLVAAKEPNPASQITGQSAPSADQRFETLAGDAASVASLRGRYVFLNFFASWCVPCEQEHPQLVAFQERHASIGDATVLQVIFSDTPDAARSFFQRRGGPDWPVLIDPKGQFALDYGVRAPPETFLIDPSGVVVANVKGAVDAPGLEVLLGRAKAGRS